MRSCCTGFCLGHSLRPTRKPTRPSPCGTPVTRTASTLDPAPASPATPSPTSFDARPTKSPRRLALQPIVGRHRREFFDTFIREGDQTTIVNKGGETHTFTPVHK